MKFPQTHRTLAMIFFAVLVLILAGCSGQGTHHTPTLTSIVVTPVTPSIGLGGTQQFTATGTYSDSSTQNITSSVTWSSGTLATATITSPGGLATAVATGTSTITATSGAVSGNTLLTVTPPALVSIKITPANPTIAVGATADFTGVGLYSDGSTQPIVGPITWSSGTPATATIISTSGVALGVATGTSTITASGGGVTGTTVLTVGASASRFAYVGNGGDGSISIYAVNGSTFTPRGYVFDSRSAIQVIPDPSGHFLFALNGNDNTISTYYIDPIGGGLTDASTLTVPIVPVVNGTGVGSLPYEGTIDPTGRFLYVANNLDNTVTSFSVNTATGALTEIGTPTNAGNGPTMVLTDRSGKFLYVVNNIDGTISGFAINATTGALTALATVPAFPATAGNSPFFGAVDPSNKYLYVGNFGDDTLSGFSINTTTGALTAIAGSPFSVAAGAGPYGVAFDPATKYLYVGNFNNESVSGFAIGASGVLGASLFPDVSSSPTGAVSGSTPFSLSIDPAGTYVTVANQGSNTLAQFSLAPATGILTPVAGGNVETRGGPQFVNIDIAAAAPTLGPGAVFATNATAGTASTGAITPTAAPVTGVVGNIAATSDVSGAYLYATSGTGKDLSAFNITQSTAALVGLTSSPFSTGTSVPGTVVADPSDRYVFTAGVGAPGSVLGYSLDTTTNSLNAIALPPSVTNLKTIVQDPQGQSLYGLGVNVVEALPINAISGAVVAGPTLATPGTWTSGAVDGSGQYLLALDSVGKKIQAFSIGPLATFATVGAAVPTGLAAPSSIVIDPLNRFVFVSDTTANTISVYSFNPLTGAVNGTAVSTSSALNGLVGQMAIDASGKYLYVAVEGTPVTNAGSVAVFTIGSTGTLTANGAPVSAGVGTSGVAVSNSIQ
jgi:6-phosphogluconolactonase (cycloisomerase 2 family)